MIKEVWAIAREKRREKADAKHRVAIARAFNDLYTYRRRYVDEKDRLPGTAMGGVTPRGGNAWMCPECNRVHLAIGCSVFDGLHYPVCCGHAEGNRHFAGIKMGK